MKQKFTSRLPVHTRRPSSTRSLRHRPLSFAPLSDTEHTTGKTKLLQVHGDMMTGEGKPRSRSRLNWASLYFLGPGWFPFISQTEKRNSLNQMLQSWSPQDHPRTPWDVVCIKITHIHASPPRSCARSRCVFLLGSEAMVKVSPISLDSFSSDGSSKSVSDKLSWSLPQRLSCPLPESSCNVFS